MKRQVNVLGVGMTQFKTPKNADPYDVMGVAAGRLALSDAGLDYRDIEQAYVGFVYGDSTAGQRVVYELGMTGIPVFNVNNNCATGSSALYLARQAVESGMVECALALGFEQMQPGALVNVYDDRPSPLAKFIELAKQKYGDSNIPMAPLVFGGAGREYMEKYGTKPETFGRITVKARQHAARNPNAVFREPVTLEQVMQSPSICDPVTRFQCCPPTCGAAAAIVCSEDFARRKGLKARVRIAAQAMTTDTPSTFGDSLISTVGYDMSRAAALQVYEAAGIGPEDVKVIELHDCFSTNEVLNYEALGLTPEGTAERMIEDGDNTYGGKYVVNPSGGLISKGHPLGATGLAQCAELNWHLRDEAGERQVEGARVALQHNIGLGGCCVVTLYERIN
ncbi:MAG: lipid-transfer protein [Gammaproteobacteria bacterium]|nr:lipid-transfer protein [Gammaproteobacteria bacterium]